MSALHPSTAVALSATTYSTLLTLAQTLNLPTADLTTNLKAISSLHATVTTGLALYALSRPWSVEHALPPLNLGLGTSNFNDSTNPMIAGYSALGNAVTGLETGYLLFDTLALVYASHRSLNARSTPKGSRTRNHDIATALTTLTRKDPLILFHHLSLLTGLGTLQHFIAHNRERGVYIIVALILMNASTPLLHLRWYRRKRTGRGSLVLDVALAALFGACRVVSVWWVLREYGKLHGIGVWEAFRGQRWICQLGTGALLGVNGLWLGGLVRSIVGRVVETARDGKG